MKKIFNFFTENYFHSTERLEVLEGIRAWAVLMVFNTHFFLRYVDYNYTISSPLLIRYFQFLQEGHCGVDLFFMLSGFLIFTSLRRYQHPIFFIFRRYERLLPVLFFTNISFILHQTSYKDLIDNILYLKLFEESSYFNWVTWSITYEIYFYFWAMILGLLFRKYTFNLPTFIILIIIIGINNLESTPFILYRFSTFLWGMAIASIYYQYWEKAQQYVKPLFLPAVLLIIYLRFELAIKGEQTFGMYILLQIGFALLLLSALADNLYAKRIFRWKPLRFIGNISFSFYVIHGIWGINLSHSFTNVITHNEVNTLKFVSHYFVAFILTVALAAFLYYYLEKPYFRKNK